MAERDARSSARRLESALRFPFRADDYVLTLLVGVMLLEFGHLLLPAFLYMGYQVAVLRAVARGADSPPPFGDVVERFLDGVKAFLVGLGFLVNPATVALAIVGVYLGFPVEPLLELASEVPVGQLQRLPIAALVGNQEVVRAVASFVERVLALGVLGYASVVAFGAVTYLYPASLVRFALDEEHSMDAARDLGVLAGVLLSPRYLATWLVVFGLYALQGLAVLVPLYFPVGAVVDYGSVTARLWRDLLYLLAFAVVFHLQVGAAYLVASRYAEIRPPGTADRPVVGFAQQAREWALGFVRRRVPSAERRASGRGPEASRADGVLASTRQRLYGPIASRPGERLSITLLIGAFAVSQTLGLLPLVVSSGLLARVTRTAARGPASADAPAGRGDAGWTDDPDDRRWFRLLTDGIRVLALWIAAAVPPGLLIVLWTAIGGTLVGPGAQSRLEALAIPGVLVGALGGFSLFYLGLYEAALGFWSRVLPLLVESPADVLAHEGTVLAVLVGVLVVEGYLFPAAVANVATTGRLVAGLSRRVVRRAFSRRYLRGWVNAMSVAAAGFAPFVWWLFNTDVLGGGPGGTGPVSMLDPELDLFLLPLPIGFLPVTELLTLQGAPAHLLFLVVSLVYFYAQAVAFSIVGRAWGRSPSSDSRGSDHR